MESFVLLKNMCLDQPVPFKRARAHYSDEIRPKGINDAINH